MIRKYLAMLLIVLLALTPICIAHAEGANPFAEETHADILSAEPPEGEEAAQANPDEPIIMTREAAAQMAQTEAPPVPEPEVAAEDADASDEEELGLDEGDEGSFNEEELDDFPESDEESSEDAASDEDQPDEGPPVEVEPTPTPAPDYNPLTPEVLYDNHIEGQSAMLINAITGSVIYEKAADAKRYPASTTKIMTLLLAIESGQTDLVVETTEEMVRIPTDSSSIDLQVGDRMAFEALLYGMMLKSGNDAANAVAITVGGSLDNFVMRMNERAKELGCANTNFTNVHGYQNENHYTTARDMSLIAAEGMKYELFRKIVSTPYFTLPATLHRAQGLDITNGNLMVIGSSEFYYAPMLGIKTGYHSDAGQCFVGAANKDNIELISVTFNTSQNGRWEDTRRLMEYGFLQYRPFTFAEMYQLHPMTLQIANADQNDDSELTLVLSPDSTLSDYTARLRTEEASARLDHILNNSEIEYVKQPQAPIEAGELMAVVTAKYADGRALTANLLAGKSIARAVEAPPMPVTAAVPDAEDEPQDFGWMKILLLAFGVLALLAGGLYAFLYMKKQRERERMREARRRKRMVEQRRAKMQTPPTQRPVPKAAPPKPGSRRARKSEPEQ